jgi:drug/metabolite transporter (DMT)-like permease
MDKLITHLGSIVSPDWATLAVAGLLCAVAAYILKEYLAHPPMVIFVYPVMVFCSLAAYYLFVVTEQLNPKKIDQWLMWAILASICGTVIGIVAVSAAALLREKLGGPRRIPPAPSKPTRAIR